jgi:tRNA-Thr(GGU) m(6)t(6)A37 methyltransferase TsaA
MMQKDKSPPNSITPIGVIHSPFEEKFGIPRQPDLAPSGTATLTLLPPFDRAEAVAGLSGFSHVWLIFGFHAISRQGWHPTVRPPRLGGNRRMGVFATRATHRPNGLGLSAVRLLDIDTRSGVVLTLGGADVLNGTPVYDIKPYLPFVDSVPHARTGFVDAPPAATLAVAWADTVQALPARQPQLAQLITEVLAQDPRPAFHDDPREYGMRLAGHNIRWRVVAGVAQVLEVAPVPPVAPD